MLLWCIIAMNNQVRKNKGIDRGLSVSSCHCRTCYISYVLSPNTIERHHEAIMADITRGFGLARKMPTKLASTQSTPCRTQTSKTRSSRNHRIVICLAIWLPLLPTPPSRDAEALTPALRSKTFQNLRLSSAAKFKMDQ